MLAELSGLWVPCIMAKQKERRRSKRKAAIVGDISDESAT